MTSPTLAKLQAEHPQRWDYQFERLAYITALESAITDQDRQIADLEAENARLREQLAQAIKDAESGFAEGTYARMKQLQETERLYQEAQGYAVLWLWERVNGKTRMAAPPDVHEAHNAALAREEQRRKERE